MYVSPDAANQQHIDLEPVNNLLKDSAETPVSVVNSPTVSTVPESDPPPGDGSVV